MNANEMKAPVIAAILKNETYLPESALYGRVKAHLESMPVDVLHSLNLILTFRISESNALAVKVERICSKERNHFGR